MCTCKCSCAQDCVSMCDRCGCANISFMNVCVNLAKSVCVCTRLCM